MLSSCHRLILDWLPLVLVKVADVPVPLALKQAPPLLNLVLLPKFLPARKTAYLFLLLKRFNLVMSFLLVSCIATFYL